MGSIFTCITVGLKGSYRDGNSIVVGTVYTYNDIQTLPYSA